MKMAVNISLRILESIEQPAYSVDRNYIYTFVNQSFCEYYQKSEKEIIGVSIEDIVGKELFRDQIKPYLDRCLKGEEVSFNCNPCRSGNTEFVGKIYLYPFCANNGSITGVISISDVRNTEQAIKELRDREREFRMLAENSTDIIYSTDLYQHFTYVSPSVEKILGYTVEETMSLNPKGIMTEASYWNQLNAFKEVLADPQSTQETTEVKTLEFIRKDGSTIWGEVNARLLFDTFGHPRGILGICRDVTQRKKDEEHRKNVVWLSQSALDFLELSSVDDIYQYVGKYLNELIPNSVIIINDINVPEKTITTRHLFGLGNNKLKPIINTLGMDPVGKQYPFEEELKDYYQKQRLVRFHGGLGEFSFGHLNPELAKQIERLLNLKDIYTIGLRQDSKLYSAIHILKFNAPGIQYFDMVETFLHQASIALQRQMLENDLREAKEKAEENERLKTAFLANLSHEIRTPLNIILGYVQLLDNPELSSETRRQYIDAVHNSSDHLIDIINDVLSMARLETGQQALHNTRFNLNDLMLEIYFSFESKARRKSIRFYCYKPLHDDQSIIRSDENKVRQVLVNLLNNAFKFTPEGGEVSFGYSLEKHHMRFFVKDNGIGISEEHHEKIFERFIQLEDSSSRKYEGTGLGLSISRGLVELLGGTIRVESIPACGSTFTFDILLRE